MIKKTPLPSRERLHELFTYSDGKLFRRRNPNAPVGTDNGTGYLRVRADGGRFCVHRIIWALHYGDPPDGLDLDHINRNRQDNRLENLRLATRTQNIRNSTPRKDNTSGFPGVTLDKHSGRWMATIQINRKQRTLGKFASPEEASQAYQRELLQVTSALY